MTDFRILQGKPELTAILSCTDMARFAIDPGGNSWYFRTGVCHYKVSILTLSGILDEKVGPFSEFLGLMEVSKVRFWRLFWEKMASIFKKFSKNCGFLVQTRSKKSINSVFFWFVICVIKITDPIWNFLQILKPFPEFLWKIDIPFSEFFLENVTLTRGTPPCTPHMEVPPPGHRYVEPWNPLRSITENMLRWLRL